MVPILVIPNANIAAVVGLIKRLARRTVKNIAYSVGISSGSAQKILTQQLKLRKVFARYAPIALLKNQNATLMKMTIYFNKNAKIETNLDF